MRSTASQENSYSVNHSFRQELQIGITPSG
uniref:Uncharacterized protein n=1 Tax=Siphoviridae sp. ct2vX3 TaxID=2825318 RepID=A0A8S5PZM9_9CAUD|nr:MAG TPA: hypothetical protein [Siphoviridae sp. ct2vX3]